MTDLFSDHIEHSTENENLLAAKPLAARIRPSTLEDFVGQEHLVGKTDV
jgi:replication-associated recombination protein RarA